MSANVQARRSGAATITIINVGDLAWNLSQFMDVPETEWAPRYADLFPQWIHIPINCIHIALGDMSILIDCAVYNIPPNARFAIPNYQPPPDLTTQLATVGVEPRDITHVVITHAHFDHFNGTTYQQDDQYIPTYPNARHYLGRAEWDDAKTKLQDLQSLESRTLGILYQQQLLELVDGNHEIASGVQIFATPGETRGHQIVRINPGGQPVYCFGDLYHHPIEVEQPAWVPYGRDASVSLASRKALAQAALADNALLIAAHIHGTGRLQEKEEGVTWVEV